MAFHRDVMMKCVTHDGDLFDPSGTLTGGSRATGASVLAKLHQLAEAEADLEARTAELNGAPTACFALLSAFDSNCLASQLRKPSCAQCRRSPKSTRSWKLTWS